MKVHEDLGRGGGQESSEAALILKGTGERETST